MLVGANIIFCRERPMCRSVFIPRESQDSLFLCIRYMAEVMLNFLINILTAVFTRSESRFFLKGATKVILI